MRVTPNPSTITGAFHDSVADAPPLKVPRTQMYVVRLFHLRVRGAVRGNHFVQRLAHVIELDVFLTRGGLVSD